MKYPHSNKKSALFLLSPISLAIFMLMLSILFTLVPKQIYETYINESNKSFLNFKMYAYMIVMVNIFILGCIISDKIVQYIPILIPKNKQNNIFNLIIAASPVFYLIIMLNIIYILQLTSQFGAAQLFNFIVAPTNSGRTILESATGGNGLSWLGGVSVAITGFSLWLFLLSDKFTSKWRRTYILIIFLILFILTLITTLLTQARGPTLLLVLQLVFVIASTAAVKGKLSIGRLIGGVMIFLTVAVLFWLGVQASRFEGSSNNNSLIGTLIGYFPASYNRLALSLDNKVSLPGAGAGYIASRWIYTFPALSNFWMLLVWRAVLVFRYPLVNIKHGLIPLLLFDLLT
ncbi:hypothetical protein [Deinococcus petrolearius]|uniref:Uncharacterized protein n=1 Tax=Deinococcus petrolearius TaxID=1751295 RepID=A0ABW1DIU7_9DEIO